MLFLLYSIDMLCLQTCNMGVKLVIHGSEIKGARGRIECTRPYQDCLGHLGPDVVRGPGSCCDERTSHPQYIRGIVRSRMMDKR